MTTTRPPSFDARVMAYLPGLKNLACKYAPPAHRNDLVTDTLIEAFDKWQNFREDGGMWNWLAWQMRGLATNGAKKAKTRKATGTLVSMDGNYRQYSAPPRQEDYTDLSAVLGRLSGIRGGDVLLARAMGRDLLEIANGRGVTRQRIQQIECRARELLLAGMREAA